MVDHGQTMVIPLPDHGIPWLQTMINHGKTIVDHGLTMILTPGMSSRAFLINAFCFRRDKNDVLGTKIGQLGLSERQ